MRTCLPLLLVACAYEPPLDDEAPGLLNGMTGTVIFSGPGAPSTTFVTLFSADDPGPPAGTGSPVTFATVPAASFTGRDQGIESAPFAFSNVPDGRYFVNGLMDHDGDFNPFGSGLAGATCDDAVGSHLNDLVSFEPVPVTLRGGELVENVTVLLGGPLPTERPAFAPPEGIVVSRSALANSLDAKGNPVVENLQLVPLDAVGIAAAYSRDLVLDLPGPCATEIDCTGLPACPCAPDPGCDTALPVWLVDADADGMIDPYPDDLQAAQGLLDVWPRVFVEYLGDPAVDPDTGAGTYVNDLGTFRFEGRELPERWVTEAFPLAADLQGAAAQGIPPELVAGGPIGVPFGVASLRVTFTPIFRHYHGDGVAGSDVNGPYDLVNLADPSVPAGAVPAGSWSTTLVAPTGQTWTVPNEIGLLGLPAAAPGVDLSTQARAIVFD